MNTFESLGIRVGELKQCLSSENSRGFFERVYTQPLTTYSSRLAALGFVGFERVLDAGCGFGQWTVAMSLQNEFIDAIDIDGERIGLLRTIAEQGGLTSISPIQASLETYKGDRQYDAIFCYSAVYMTDVPRAIQNLTSNLAPGGVIYFNTNDLGWYLYNICQGHNDSLDFSSQEFGIAVISNTLSWLNSGSRSNLFPVITTQNQFLSDLRKAGLSVVAHGPDGSINLGEQPTDSFFESEFMGVTSVFEVLCRKEA